MSDPVEHVTVCDGKYTLIMDPGGLRALRYGETWRDLTGDGFVMALGHEILSLKEKLKIARTGMSAQELFDAADIVRGENSYLASQLTQAGLAMDKVDT